MSQCDVHVCLNVEALRHKWIRSYSWPLFRIIKKLSRLGWHIIRKSFIYTFKCQLDGERWKSMSLIEMHVIHHYKINISYIVISNNTSFDVIISREMRTKVLIEHSNFNWIQWVELFERRRVCDWDNSLNGVYV